MLKNVVDILASRITIKLVRKLFKTRYNESLTLFYWSVLKLIYISYILYFKFLRKVYKDINFTYSSYCYDILKNVQSFRLEKSIWKLHIIILKID